MDELSYDSYVNVSEMETMTPMQTVTAWWNEDSARPSRKGKEEIVAMGVKPLSGKDSRTVAAGANSWED